MVRTGLIVVAVILCSPESIQGQQRVADGGQSGDELRKAHAILARPITLHANDLSLAQAIRAVASQANARIQYRVELLQEYPALISFNFKGTPLSIALEQLLAKTKLRAVPLPEGIIGVVVNEDGAHRKGNPGTISGQVRDANSKRPIQGVTITIVVGNGKKVTTSNDSGEFLVRGVPAGTHPVSVHRLGYKSAKKSVGVRDDSISVVMFSMEPMETTLSEVVTTATGLRQRVEIPSDVARVNAESLYKAVPVQSVSDLIQLAHVPGVLVTPSSGDPGAPSRIRMRGAGSLSLTNDPVIVLDGAIINSQLSTTAVKNTATNGYVPSRLDNLDPASIETLEFVRGPSAAALYGPQAANGVIVITTKKGRPGPTRWNVSYRDNYTMLPGNTPPIYRGWGHPIDNPTSAVPCAIADVISGLCVQDSVGVQFPSSSFSTNETRGRTQALTTTVSGGMPALTYSLTGSYSQDGGNKKMANVDQVRMRILHLPVPTDTRRPTGLDQNSLTAQVSIAPHPKVDIGMNFTTTQGTQNQSTPASFASGWSFPSGSVDTTTLLDKSGTLSSAVGGSKATSSTLSMSSSWRPQSWATMQFNAGVDRANQDNEQMTDRYVCVTGVCANAPGTKVVSVGQTSIYSAKGYVNFSPSLGWLSRALSLKPSIGFDYQQNATTSASITGSDLAAGSHDIGTAMAIGASQSSTQTANLGWYAVINIGVFNRWYFDVGLRRDAANVFQQPKSLPKLGTSWLVSDESWFPKQPVVTALRLRAAYGRSTVEPASTDLLGLFQAGRAYVGGRWIPTVTLTQAQNSQVRPEASSEFEFGGDLSFFNERATFSLTGSRKRNANNLVDRAVAPSVGMFPVGGVISTRRENVALILNHDIEMSLGARVIDKPNLLWMINANFSILDNQVKSLGKGLTPFHGSGVGVGRIVEGFPIDGAWTLPVLQYADANHDGFITKDEVVVGDSAQYVGWPQPRFTAGYNTSLSTWNGRLTFTAIFGYKGQYTQYLGVYNRLGLQDVRASLAEQAYSVIAAGAGSPVGISELRLNAASMTFNLPSSWIERFRASSASVSLQGSNLGLWTSYRGRDPAVNASPIGEGLVDSGTLTPSRRQYVLVFSLGY